jgi:UDP-2-acetamido-3-amino-2,3-dideoxy-glucuronate N-acetyltransferase
MLAPHVPAHEPLRLEIDHFVESVVTRRRPLTDGEHGRDVVAVLEAAERSSRADGERTPVSTIAATRP